MRTWQDIALGEQFSTGELAISEEQILDFAREFDPQPYHLDAGAAADSIFGGLCASGWQAAALMMRLLTDSLREQAVAVTGVSGVPALRWRQPVFAGDRLSAEFTVTERQEASRLPGSGGLTLRVQVLNQDARAVMNLDVRLMVARAEAAA
jgi:acyl dehydratase